MQTPEENPLMTIESFNRQFQIGEKERDAVKLRWEVRVYSGFGDHVTICPSSEYCVPIVSKFLNS
jgi:hypothetical protein